MFKISSLKISLFLMDFSCWNPKIINGQIKLFSFIDLECYIYIKDAFPTFSTLGLPHLRSSCSSDSFISLHFPGDCLLDRGAAGQVITFCNWWFEHLRSSCSGDSFILPFPTDGWPIWGAAVQVTASWAQPCPHHPSIRTQGL